MAVALPNFFLVGAPKAGTTSLYRYLGQHPDVYVSPIKEPCFFAPEVVDVSLHARQAFDADAADLRRYLDGPMRQGRDHGFVLDWEQYLKLFKRVRDEAAVGEGSVAYLASPVAARAIRTRIPHARIVMVLRNPVDRLFSRFLAAKDADPRTCFSRWIDEQTAADETRSTAYGSIWPGRYAVHLQRYLESFPPHHVRVFLYDDYASAPATVLRDVFSFLHVNPDCPIDVGARHNVTMTPRWPALHKWLIKPLVPAVRAIVSEPWVKRLRRFTVKPRQVQPSVEDRARAAEIYEADIRVLERLIHRDLSNWLSTG